jgi:hypothetical protein
MLIRKGVIIKPKMYVLEPEPTGDVDKDKPYIKIKGVGCKMSLGLFNEIMLQRQVKYERILQFRESLRRKLNVNSVVEITKHLDLEDNKRAWSRKFNPLELQSSTPLDFINGELPTGPDPDADPDKDLVVQVKFNDPVK